MGGWICIKNSNYIIQKNFKNLGPLFDLLNNTNACSFRLTIFACRAARCQVLPNATDLFAVDDDTTSLVIVMLHSISCAELVGPTLRNRRNLGIPVLNENE